MDYEGTYSQKWTPDYVLHYYLYLNHFKMNGLQRGTLTEMNPGLMFFIIMGQFRDEWVMGILAKKLTSDWSDTVAKWFKHLTVDQKVPGLNPTCCFTGKVFSLLLLPLGDYQAFAWKGLEVKIIHFYLLTVLVHMAKCTLCSCNYKQRTGFMSSKPPTDFIAGQFYFLSLETVTLTQERF